MYAVHFQASVYRFLDRDVDRQTESYRKGYVRIFLDSRCLKEPSPETEQSLTKFAISLLIKRHVICQCLELCICVHMAAIGHNQATFDDPFQNLNSHAHHIVEDMSINPAGPEESAPVACTSLTATMDRVRFTPWPYYDDATEPSTLGRTTVLHTTTSTDYWRPVARYDGLRPTIGS